MDKNLILRGSKIYKKQKWDSVKKIEKYLSKGWEIIDTKERNYLYAEPAGELSKKNLLRINLSDIKKEIENTGWFFFGDKDFQCPGITKENIESYFKKRELPKPCNRCYKALLFLDNSSEQTINNLLLFLSKIDFEIEGKFNNEVVVFYFDDKNDLDNFLEKLKRDLPKFQISARVQWRRACKEFQNLKPEWWKNAKEFSPDTKTGSLLDYY